eukprot:gene3488-3986_t
MELNTSALEGLQILGDSTMIQDKAFGIIIDDSFNIALGLYSENSPQGMAGVNLVQLKQCCYGILTAIYEACKTNADKSSFSSVLEECRWTPDRIEFLTKKYEECKDGIQIELARIGTSHPHVVDIDWRLDYYIKNNHLDKINEASYLISLKTQETGVKLGEDVTFTCSFDQLQDLVGKLKDATKCLEKASQM